MSTTSQYTDQILISLNADKSIRSVQKYDHLQVTDDSGKVTTMRVPPADITEADANDLLTPALTAALAQVNSLTSQLSAAQKATSAAQADATAKSATIATLEAQLAALQTAAAGSDDLLGSLNALFAQIPAGEQAEFANVYATVRVLIQAGQQTLALAVVQGVAVPDALAALKAQIVAALTPAANPVG